jgi:glutamyl-tRNA reductase
MTALGTRYQKYVISVFGAYCYYHLGESIIIDPRSGGVYEFYPPSKRNKPEMQTPDMRILLRGISHRTAPVELREQFAVEPSRLADATRAILRVPGVREAIIISTCNRTELAVCYGPKVPDFSLFLAEFFGVVTVQFTEHMYEYYGINAVQHLFRVACSLDSLVLGEPQILGQVKNSYAVARSIGAVRSNLERLMQSAFSTAKKVRSDTKIGDAPVSVASVAIDLIKKVFGSLRGRRILLVGAGKMSELAASHLIEQGAESIAVANRTFENALGLAGRLGGHAVRFENVHSTAAEADIVITSTGNTGYIFRREDGSELMRLRKNRPLFFVDIAVPRDVDPEINHVEGIFVYDIDSLQSISSAHRENRSREAEKAEMIVAQEAIRYHRRSMALDVAPAIRGLRAAMEAIEQTELRRVQSKLRMLTPDQQQATRLLLCGMTNKILHPVIRTLKQAAQHGDLETMETICSIFDLAPLPQTHAGEDESSPFDMDQSDVLTA